MRNLLMISLLSAALTACSQAKFAAMSGDGELSKPVFGQTVSGNGDETGFPTGGDSSGSVAQPSQGGLVNSGAAVRQPSAGGLFPAFGNILSSFPATQNSGSGSPTSSSNASSGSLPQPTTFNSSTGLLPPITPALVCGPQAMSTRTPTLANSNGVKAAIYRCDDTGINCSLVSQLSSALSPTALASQIQKGKPIQLNAGAPLSAGSYKVLLFPVNTAVPNSVGMMSSAGAVAPIEDSLAQMLTGSPTFSVDSSGNYTMGTDPFNVLLDTTSITSQPSALCQQNNVGSIDPLIIDFSGKGIVLSSQQEGIEFDLEGNGRLEQVSWPVNRLNMFLVHGVSADGRISGANFFGNYSVGPDGMVATNGFVALKKYDSNGDDVIDRTDPIFAQLALWSDVNRDGISQANELKTLEEMGVTAIHLRSRPMLEQDRYGNQTTLRARVQLASGKVRVINDVWFKPAP